MTALLGIEPRSCEVENQKASLPLFAIIAHAYYYFSRPALYYWPSSTCKITGCLAASFRSLLCPTVVRFVVDTRCLGDQVQCTDSERCVSRDRICNGYPDCGWYDTTDELNCTGRVPSDSLTCSFRNQL